MVIAWWNEKRSETVALNAADILYGYEPESNLFQALNHFVNIAKIPHLPFVVKQNLSQL